MAGFKLNGKEIKSEMPVVAPVMVGGEAQELHLTMKTLTPRDHEKIKKELKTYDRDRLTEAHEYIASLITGWKDVADRDGNPIEFSKDKLVEFQGQFHGLGEAIVAGIDEAVGKLLTSNFTDSVTAYHKRRKKTK